MDPDQAQHFVWPDLGPICLQGLSADDTSRQRVNFFHSRSQETGSLANSEDPDEMPYKAAFHLGLHCLLN